MAIPYPQGECFFKRSSLTSEKPDRFNAENPAHFYSTLIVETIWNKEAYHGEKNCQNRSNPRSDLKVVYGGGGWKTHYGNWSHIPFTYGNYAKPETVNRRIRHELCTWGYRFKKREWGDAYEAWFMFVPMPRREEEWIYIDRLATIRAIYIPVAHQSSEKYPDLCTYVQCRFISMKQVTMEYHKSTGEGKDPSKVQTTIDCLVTTLIVPRDFRKLDAFTSNAVMLVDSSLIPTAPLQQTLSDQCMADWAVVMGANQGLSIEWKKGDFKGHWFISYFKNAMSFAIGYLPLAGPFLAIGWNVAYTAIAQPDEFLEQLREQIPSVELIEGFVSEIKKMAQDGEEVLQDGIDVKKLSGVETKISNASPLDDEKDEVQAKPAAVVETPTGEGEQAPTTEEDEKHLTKVDQVSRMIGKMKSASISEVRKWFDMSLKTLDKMGLLTDEVCNKLERASDPFDEPSDDERWDEDGNFIENQNMSSPDEKWAKIARGLLVQMLERRLEQALKFEIWPDDKYGVDRNFMRRTSRQYMKPKTG
ncbi:hypothetical protein N7520_006633 [Penicillium odoratum]|uniref:uncharacterized protein n=1 Tax=Penicillium odoratum TaxID=1167516 RepID=UPI0025490521|nr:uncharacterized protein N7520_006633 [Penicillium odoratum]KAJ5759477.1 hypothetical protein N7520_006633 [Penicillium odoratum]